jgi:hypothetical protein
MAVAAQPSEPISTDHEVGVLIVSGLAEPSAGGALIVAADALRESLDRWLTRDDADDRERRERRAKLQVDRDKATGSERELLDAELAQLDATPHSVSPAVDVRDVLLTTDPDTPPNLRLTVSRPGIVPPQEVTSWRGRRGVVGR